jgi:signal transduction histidine kinase
LRPGSVGIGLGGMRQRAKEFGGELRLKNADPGTLIEVTIPLKAGNSEVQATQASLRGARS